MSEQPSTPRWGNSARRPPSDLFSVMSGSSQVSPPTSSLVADHHVDLYHSGEIPIVFDFTNNPFWKSPGSSSVGLTSSTSSGTICTIGTFGVSGSQSFHSESPTSIRSRSYSQSSQAETTIATPRATLRTSRESRRTPSVEPEDGLLTVTEASRFTLSTYLASASVYGDAALVADSVSYADMVRNSAGAGQTSGDTPSLSMALDFVPPQQVDVSFVDHQRTATLGFAHPQSASSAYLQEAASVKNNSSPSPSPIHRLAHSTSDGPLRHGCHQESPRNTLEPLAHDIADIADGAVTVEKSTLQDNVIQTCQTSNDAPLASPHDYSGILETYSRLQSTVVHVWIDQEGFRAICPLFKFVRVYAPSNHSQFSDAPQEVIAEFKPLKRQPYTFHYAAFDTEPSLHRVTINGDESRDYISRQACLSIKANGVYSVNGTEERRSAAAHATNKPTVLRWRLEYVVEDRRAEATGRIISGEKTITPLSFSFSPGLFEISQGIKVKFLHVLRKNLAPKVAAERMNPPSLPGPPAVKERDSCLISSRIGPLQHKKTASRNSNPLVVPLTATCLVRPIIPRAELLQMFPSEQDDSGRAAVVTVEKPNIYSEPQPALQGLVDGLHALSPPPVLLRN